MRKNILTTKQKALDINLDETIQGSFSEIGAGQETSRHFFRAGAAAMTVVKTMSAYDKTFSDVIYGKEDDGRYVTKSRLRRMLQKENDLISKRLREKLDPSIRFFAFANTVTTINFSKTHKGHGWLGIRFEKEPMSGYNEIVIHIHFKENEARLQQETLGMVGVNLVYGAFRDCENPIKILRSLMDNIDRDALEINSIEFSGPDFSYVDNRLISLELARSNLTHAVIFQSDGQPVLAADLLYKKNLVVIRGSFRPVTKVNMDMFERGLASYLKTHGLEDKRDEVCVVFEITLNNLLSANEDQSGMINERDFLDRADILCSLGHNVLISNYSEYYKLVDYFASFTKNKIGLIMGVPNLLEVFDMKYYSNLSGGILEAFGKVFRDRCNIFLYPWHENDMIINSHNLKVDDSLHDLYKYFKTNGKIIDIEHIDETILDIYSREVLKMIKEGKKGWEDALPIGVAEIIKAKQLFGYRDIAL